MVGPVVQDLGVVDEVNTNGKRNGSTSEPTQVGVNENDVGDVGQHAKGETNFAPMFDVLWSHLPTDEANECVSDRVHAINPPLAKDPRSTQ